MPVFLDDIAARASLSAAALHAALLILMLVGLTYFVIFNRRRAKVGLGDGGDTALGTAMRMHGNFAENAPFAIGALILLGLIGAAVWFIHFVGLAMLAGRIMHALGLWKSRGASMLRAAGMLLTHLSLLAAVAALMRFAL